MDRQILHIEDIDKIKAFNKLCFPTDFWKDEDWENLLTDVRATYYALMDGENIVGNVFTYNWAGENDYLKVMNIGVHPDYRRRGIASTLMGYVMDEFQVNALDKICGETRASNQAMQKTFEKFGFLLNNIVENGFSNPEEDEFKYVYFRKDIPFRR